MKSSILKSKEKVLKFLLREWDKKEPRFTRITLHRNKYSLYMKNTDETLFMKIIEILVSDRCVKIYPSKNTIWNSDRIELEVLAPSFEYFDKQKHEKRNAWKLTRREVILMVLSALITGMVTYIVTMLTTTPCP